MTVFNKKHIGAMILRKIGAPAEYADAYESTRRVMHYDKACGSAVPASEEERTVIERIEEEKNYYTYAVIPAADGSPLYLVTTDETVKLVNINIEYDNDPFDGVLKHSEDGSGYLLSACADTPEAAIIKVSVAVSGDGMLYCS